MTDFEKQTQKGNERVAVITGSSRGIGAAIALDLANEGVRVVVNYHQRREAAEAVVSSIESAGGCAVAVEADVATPEGNLLLAEAALKAFRRVDILVNNATPLVERKPLLDLTLNEVDDYWRTYVQSSFLLAKQFVPGMKERRFGRVIHILTSYIWGVPPPALTGYVVAKSALWGLTKSMAVDLAPFGITVNAVSPAEVMTDQWKEVPEARRRALELRTPLQRLAKPDDVAAAVRFLIGSQGAFITGANIPVAGGAVM